MSAADTVSRPKAIRDVSVVPSGVAEAAWPQAGEGLACDRP